MKIRLVEAELFHANRQTERQTDRRTDRQTDRQTGKYDESNRRFSKFYKTPKQENCL